MLGSIIADSRAKKIAFEMLVSDDFYLFRNREIFEICKEIQGELDAISFRNELKKIGKLHLDENSNLVAELLESGSPGNIESYCCELQRLSRARKLQSAATKALLTVETDSDAGTKSALAELFEIDSRCERKIQPVEALKQQIQNEIDGLRTALEIPQFSLLTSTKCFLPGSITVLCGHAGSSKSLITAECCWRLFEFGVKTAKMDLESSPEFHLRRIMAQMAKNSKLTNDNYSRAESDEICQVISHFELQLRQLVSERIMQTPSGGKQMDCAGILRWISQSADEGKQVLFIDPITMMKCSERSWLDQENFIQGARGIVDRKQIRLVIVTHPKKAGTGESPAIHLDNISGSTAFAWFVDTVFWLEAHTVTKAAFTNSLFPADVYTEDYNRTIHVLKSRLGGMAGKKIGYYMDSQTLLHIERGIIE